MRQVVLLMGVALILTACGGGRERVTRTYSNPSITYASGPISQACLRADRKAANSRLCGCVQGVANRELSSSDQRMAAGFFSDPHQAQVIRQSDRSSHEVFWKRYKAFAAKADRTCKGL